MSINDPTMQADRLACVRCAALETSLASAQRTMTRLRRNITDLSEMNDNQRDTIRKLSEANASLSIAAHPRRWPAVGWDGDLAVHLAAWLHDNGVADDQTAWELATDIEPTIRRLIESCRGVVTR